MNDWHLDGKKFRIIVLCRIIRHAFGISLLGYLGPRSTILKIVTRLPTPLPEVKKVLVLNWKHSRLTDTAEYMLLGFCS